MKMVCDTSPSQDASTHQIWNSYLKEYKRYGPDTIAGWTDGQCDYYMPPKFLWGHKNTASNLKQDKQKLYEPVHKISNNMDCAISIASDQPAHTRSLIRAFASRLSIL